MVADLKKEIRTAALGIYTRYTHSLSGNPLVSDNEGRVVGWGGGLMEKKEGVLITTAAE